MVVIHENPDKLISVPQKHQQRSDNTDIERKPWYDDPKGAN